MLLLPQWCAWPRRCPSVPARGVDHRRSATMSNASLFCGTLEPNANALGIWSSARDKAEKRKQLCKSATVSSLCTGQQKERERKRDRKETENETPEENKRRNEENERETTTARE